MWHLIILAFAAFILKNQYISILIFTFAKRGGGESVVGLLNVDIVILDLTINCGMGGKEAANGILNIDKNAKLVVSSGYSNDPIVASFKEYGFCATVDKPFDLNTLSATLKQYINFF